MSEGKNGFRRKIFTPPRKAKIHEMAASNPVPRKRFEKVYVEISNICNLQCGFCPEVEREKDVMGPELFRRVVADVAPLAEQVCFHLMGEPLTHPRFAE